MLCRCQSEYRIDPINVVQGTVLNPTCHSSNGGSLEITTTGRLTNEYFSFISEKICLEFSN